MYFNSFGKTQDDKTNYFSLKYIHHYNLFFFWFKAMCGNNVYFLNIKKI
jgi:hypothetical protein